MQGTSVQLILSLQGDFLDGVYTFLISFFVNKIPKILKILHLKTSGIVRTHSNIQFFFTWKVSVFFFTSTGF